MKGKISFHNGMSLDVSTTLQDRPHDQEELTNNQQTLLCFVLGGGGPFLVLFHNVLSYSFIDFHLRKREKGEQIR